jgi:hypothetical protein
VKALADLEPNELKLVSENLITALLARQRTRGSRSAGSVTNWANMVALMNKCLDNVEALLRDDPGTG